MGNVWSMDLPLIPIPKLLEQSYCLTQSLAYKVHNWSSSPPRQRCNNQLIRCLTMNVVWSTWISSSSPTYRNNTARHYCGIMGKATAWDAGNHHVHWFKFTAPLLSQLPENVPEEQWQMAQHLGPRSLCRVPEDPSSWLSTGPGPATVPCRIKSANGRSLSMQPCL